MDKLNLYCITAELQLIEMEGFNSAFSFCSELRNCEGVNGVEYEDIFHFDDFTKITKINFKVREKNYTCYVFGVFGKLTFEKIIEVFEILKEKENDKTKKTYVKSN